MLALTATRVIGLPFATPPVVVANGAHAALVEAQINDDATVVLEPCARNTAPAIALAALVVDDPATALLVMPSDHVITDLPAFHEAIARALPLVEQGWLVTLGITPSGPETGYGYIALGDALVCGVQRVARFVEKPDRVRAEAMLAAGNHVWNAGIFLFRADAYLAALEQLAPEMLAACKASLDSADRSGRFISPGQAAFEAAPSDSIDYAVMEKADKVACVPVDMGWSDIGSWDMLHEIAETDDARNTAHGNVTLIDSHGCLVRSDSADMHISLVGVDDLTVVLSGHDIMIVPRGKSQLVKKAAEAALLRTS